MPVMSAMIALSLSLLAFGMAAVPDTGHVQDVEKWRAKHEADYRREFVALAGLFSLKPGINTAGSTPGSDIKLPKSAPAAAGRFVLTGDRVRFEPQAGVKATIKGVAVAAPVDLKHDEMKE